MADHGRNGDSNSGDGDSRRTLWRIVRRFFDGSEHDQSLRAHLEEVIDEHEEDDSSGPSGDLSQLERQMLRNLLHFSENDADDVAIPRGEIIAIPAAARWDELIAAFAEHGHSRMPVYGETLDEPRGMVHIRDLVAFMAARASQSEPQSGTDETPKAASLNLANIDLARPMTAAKIVREILYAPPSMPALDLLAKMQATRIHLALVIDEYGGSDGLVSIEDLVELIVGDIADEHDEEESPAVTRQSDGSFVANGRANLDDVRAAIGDQFDVGEVADEVDTLGGYLVTKAGHVPVRGELVPGPEPFEAEVLDADPRRVKRVKIYLRKDRRPATAREAPTLVRMSASRPAAPREHATRPNSNTPRAS